MRVVPRYVGGALAALAVGFVVSLVCAALLRSATPEADLLWRAAPTSKVAVWTHAAAHGSSIEVTASAGVASDRLGGIAERVGDLFDRDIPTSVGSTFSVLLVPLTILGLAGAALAFGAWSAKPRSGLDAAFGVGSAAAVYGIVLALIAAQGTAERGVGGRFLEAGVDVGVSPESALLLGLVWGAVFTGVGTLLAMRERLPAPWRVLGAGWVRGLGAGAAVATVGLVIWGTGRAVGGAGAPGNTGLLAVGAALLFPNAIAAALVLAHGASMIVSLDAGPFGGWGRVDYLHTGVAQDPAPLGWWLFLLVPIVAGLVAGRAMRRRTAEQGGIGSALRIGVAFGGAWAVTLTVLAMLTRARALSDFAIGFVTAGGGEAAIDPFGALIVGALWGTATATAGALTVTGEIAEPAAAAEAPATEWTCPRCTRVLPAADRFCGYCGTPRPG